MLMVSALFLVGVGCGGDSDGSNGGGAGGSVDGSTTGLLRLLGTVPDNEGNRGQPIFYGNLDRLRNGERASSLEDDVSLLIELSSNSVGLPRTVSDGILEPAFAEYTGFDTRGIAAFIDFGSQEDQVTAIVGTFDSGDLESGLRSSPGGGDLNTETSDGVTYLALGVEGEIDFAAVSAIRRLGEAVRIAVDGNVLYWSRSRALVDACVAAAGDATASLADDAGYASIAAALDTSAVITGQLMPPWGGESWIVAGLGETFQGETSTLTVALHYADEATAAAAVNAFRAHLSTGVSLFNPTPWSEVLMATDIHAEGSLMVATLTSQNPGIASEIYFKQENLLQF
jgi:hypothetical protein